MQFPKGGGEFRGAKRTEIPPYRFKMHKIDSQYKTIGRRLSIEYNAYEFSQRNLKN